MLVAGTSVYPSADVGGAFAFAVGPLPSDAHWDHGSAPCWCEF